MPRGIERVVIEVRRDDGEGTLNFDTWVNPIFSFVNTATEDGEPEESDGGGMCTSGLHAEGCDSDDMLCGREDCEALQAKPHEARDWENALGMAVAEAVGLIERTEKPKPERKGHHRAGMVCDECRSNGPQSTCGHWKA